MTQSQRKANLLPNGKPKYVRCYDNGGKTADRYTVAYTGNYRKRDRSGQLSWFQYCCMSASPFHGRGVGMHGEHFRQIDTNKGGYAPMVGRSNHLGKRIPFIELPPDCQKMVLSDYKLLWDLI